MNKFLSSITLAFVAFIGFHNVFYYDALLNIVNRYHSGELETAVERSQTYYGILNLTAKKANMAHFDKFVSCVENGSCKATASKR